jgi:hypothetical protein
MRLLCVLLVSVFCFSFCPNTEKTAKYTNGFYVFVEDLSQRTYHKYLVESKDSVNSILKYFFESELEVGDIHKPISIYNGDINFYIARVNVFVKPNGKKSFRHLKYPKEKVSRRSQVRPVFL